jgi:hypothetical protein
MTFADQTAKRSVGGPLGWDEPIAFAASYNGKQAPCQKRRHAGRRDQRTEGDVRIDPMPYLPDVVSTMPDEIDGKHPARARIVLNSFRPSPRGPALTQHPSIRSAHPTRRRGPALPYAEIHRF